MRSFRILVLTVVVAVFVSPGFAQVCHPKKPVTCNAASFSQLAASSATTSVVTAPKTTVTTPKTTSVKPKSPAKVQQAMLCGPWVKWMCTAGPLV